MSCPCQGMGLQAVPTSSALTTDAKISPRSLGKCYSHGAPRKVCSADGCNSNAQKLGLCRKHNNSQELTTVSLVEIGYDICGDVAMDESSDTAFWEEFVRAFT